MTPSNKIVIALGALCLAIVIGTTVAHKSRTNKHYHRLLYGMRNDKPDMVVSEYHRLPRNYRSNQLVKSAYDEARKQVGDRPSLDFMPTMESADLTSLGVLVLGLFGLWKGMMPKTCKQSAPQKAALEAPDAPTVGQIAFIRRINNGVVPVGLTRSSAAEMVASYLSRMGTSSNAHKIYISPGEFMSSSRGYRDKMKLEHDRKRAQEKLARQQEQERRLREREAQKAQKAAERHLDRRMAEEEKLFKVREEMRDGILRKARNAKAQKIQEFQELVNSILADNRIEPQEVRQLKAWLLANRQEPDDFTQMLKVIDESLVDGIIDSDETQAIYEGAIDCLITLRDRRGS